jgi:ribose transport system ATP-binding protein
LTGSDFSRSDQITLVLRRGATNPSIALLAAIVLVGLFFSIMQPAFLSTANIYVIAAQSAVVTLIALGMTLVIIGQGIDLSVGSGVALTAVMGGQVMVATGASPVATIVAVIGTGLALGALNGVLIAYLRVSAFMATLGTYALAAGAAIAISKGSSIIVTDPAILWLGSASTVGGIPVSAVLTVLAVCVFWILTRRTLLGRWLYAQGGNRTAAIASGIPVRRVEFLTYVITGLMVGVGSLITIGRVHSTQPLAGQGLEFAAITAAVLGGTSLAGGRGDVVSTSLGSIFVAVVASGLSFAGVEQSMIYVFTGAFVVAAVLISQREILQGLSERVALARVSLANRHGQVQRGGEAALSRRDRHLELRGLEKRFSGVTALKSVSFDLRSGEVVALVGENGAGKSTLVKILSGDHRPNAGEVIIDGVQTQFAGPEDARRDGIAVIHQHFTLVPDLTVAENLFLGREPRWPIIGVLRRGEMNRATRKLLADLEIPVRPTSHVNSLGIGQRQMVEIAKAIGENAWLVVMDEPTSALSSRERDLLFAFIERLQSLGTAILFISHKLDEIYHVASRAVVLRDGAVVGTPNLAEVRPPGLVSLMVGRAIENLFPYIATDIAEERLVVRDARDAGLLRRASLTVRSGEVVGLVGLMGSGRTELIRCVMGLSPLVAGHIEVLGRDLGKRSAADLIELGVAYVPEDRRREGLFPGLTVSENLSLLWLRQNSVFGLLPTSREKTIVAETMLELGVRPPDPRREVRYLSGGNQQKVVLGKSFVLSPRLVLLDDPTRGVDVGAKAEIHALIARLKTDGAAILMTSSEMPEVLAVADRVVVMRHGETVAEHDRGVSEVEVMQDAFGEPLAVVTAAGAQGEGGALS